MKLLGEYLLIDVFMIMKQEDKEFKELHKAIEGLLNWYNKNMTQYTKIQ